MSTLENVIFVVMPGFFVKALQNQTGYFTKTLNLWIGQIDSNATENTKASKDKIW